MISESQESCATEGPNAFACADAPGGSAIAVPAAPAVVGGGDPEKGTQPPRPVQDELAWLLALLRSDLNAAVARYDEALQRLLSPNGGGRSAAAAASGGFPSTVATPNFFKSASQCSSSRGGGRPQGWAPKQPHYTSKSSSYSCCSESSEHVKAKANATPLSPKQQFAKSTLSAASMVWEQVKPKSMKARDSAQEQAEKEKAANKEAEIAIGFAQEEELKKKRSRERNSKAEEEISEAEEEELVGCSAKFRRQVRRFVSSREFEVFMAMLITTNTFYFGVEAEYAAQMRTNDMPEAFKDISLAYTLAFLVELVLRVYGYGWDFFCTKEWWNLFDFSLVAFSLFEVGVLLLLSHMMDANVVGAESLAYMKLLRIVRTARILRVLRIVTFFRSLRILLISVMHTMKSLFAAICLLGLILYIFGVLFTQATTQVLVDEGPEFAPDLDKYFGSVLSSVYTLFMCITGGVSWEVVNEALILVHGIWCFFFVVYIAFTYFAVLNVITGVFCQTAIESALRDQDEVVHQMKKAKQVYVNQLTELFEAVDLDGSGELTIDEFEELLADTRLEKYCASLDLTIDDAWALFKLLDTDGSGAIGVEEFVTGCLRLKGSARSVDLALTGYQLRWIIDRFEKFMAYTDEQFTELRVSTEAGADRILKSYTASQRATQAALLATTSAATTQRSASRGASGDRGPALAEGWSPKLWDDVPA